MTIPTFAVEIRHPRNADILLQSIPGCRLRTAIDPQAGISLSDDNEDMAAPTDQTIGLAGCPRVPGEQIAVDAKECVYSIRDPLRKDDGLKARLLRFMRNKTPMRVDNIDGKETRKGKLDADRTKTLCRELIWLVDAKEAVCVHGSMPKLEDVDDLPGSYLLNPGLTVASGQPRYEKDFPSWCERLTTSGL